MIVNTTNLNLKTTRQRSNVETLTAMQEDRKISRDPNVPSYSSMEDLKKAVSQDDVQH